MPAVRAPAAASTVRVMEADVETTRNGQAGVVKMGVAKKLEGNADASDQPGRPVRARPGGDPDHLSPRSPHAAAEAHAARAAAASSSRSPGTRRSRSSSAQLDALAAANDQKSLAFLHAPASQPPRRRSPREFLKRFGAPRADRRSSCSATTCCGAPTRSASATSSCRRSISRASRFVDLRSAPISSAPGTRRSRRAPPTARCGRDGRACAARSCRSSRGCR